VSTVGRAFDVIDAFTLGEAALTLSEVAERAKLPVATALRMLSTLEQRGIVQRDARSGVYRLGHRLIMLAELAKDPIGLLDHARPVMRRMRDKLDETIYLTVRSGDFRIDIEQMESFQGVRRVIRVGRARPLVTGCAGKLLIASLPEREAREYLDRSDLRDELDGQLTRKEVERRLALVRKNGYAESLHKFGGGAIAAAICNASAYPLAALSASAPYGRYSPALRERMIDAVVGGAKEISAGLAPSFG
jgi:IclR family acetate operon transcriptional repressor